MVVLCATIRRAVGPLQVVLGASLREADVAQQLAVSYTHLTLPTILRV